MFERIGTVSPIFHLKRSATALPTIIAVRSCSNAFFWSGGNV